MGKSVFHLRDQLTEIYKQGDFFVLELFTARCNTCANSCLCYLDAECKSGGTGTYCDPCSKALWMSSSGNYFITNWIYFKDLKMPCFLFRTVCVKMLIVTSFYHMVSLINTCRWRWFYLNLIFYSFVISIFLVAKIGEIIEAPLQTLEWVQDQRNAFSAARSSSLRQGITSHHD